MLTCLLMFFKMYFSIFTRAEQLIEIVAFVLIFVLHINL